MTRILLSAVFFFSFLISHSQNLSYTCPRDTTVGCGVTCLTLTTKVPDLRAQSSNYTLSNVSTTSVCRPYIDPGAPGNPSGISADDIYSGTITIPFNFTYYGISYNQLVISPNGAVCFDITKAGAGAHYITSPGDLPNTQYDQAQIMGPYHDLDISVTASPTKQMKYDVIGTAPNRKWIVSFFKVPLFSAACNNSFENTHQIILHESTGVIEVWIGSKQSCPTWQGGRAIVGIQDETRTKAVMAPGRGTAVGPWGTVGMNETWRFVPTDGAPLYRSTQLLDASGTVVATGDTTRFDASSYTVSFPNICPPANTTTLYVIKTTYARIDDNTQTIFSLDTVRVTRINNLPLSSTSTVSNCGASTGSITVTPSGGTTPITYTLGATVNTTGVFTGLPAGTYTIAVTDAVGCNNTISATVTALTTLAATISNTGTACTAVSNGTITVTPSGTAPYTYVLDSGTPVSGGSPYTFTNVTSGAHSVIVTDANSCTTTLTTTLSVAATMFTSSSSTALSCPGANNGTISINSVTNGTAPYQYNIDGGAFGTANVFTGLTAGTHTVIIRDANGCQITRTFTLGSGTALAATVTATNTSCPGVNNASITSTPTNGTAPYTYALDGGTAQASNTFTGVAAGPHVVVITDANGCSVTRNVTVNAGTGITGTATQTPTSCSTASNGTITVNSTTGTGVINYSLDGGPFVTTNIFNGVASGPHVVTIRDVNLCTGTINITVTVGTPFTISSTFTQTSCPTATDGTITVTVTGGTGPFTYSLDGGTAQASNIFNGVAAGPHTINVTAANTCAVSGTVTITSGTTFTGTATFTPGTCATAPNGTITLTATTGTAPFTYALDGGAFQTNSTFTGVLPGPHIGTIRDATGCTTPVNVTVGAGTGITGTATSTGSSCPTANNGTITVTVTTGTAPYTYSLDGGTAQSSNIFNGVSPTAHVVTFTDVNGCTGTTNVTVASGTPITGSAVGNNTSCASVNNGVITVTTTGVAPVQYSLDGGTSQTSNVFNGVAPGPHTINFTDANGCIGSTTLTIGSGPVLTATATSTSTSCAAVSNAVITVTTTSGVGPFLYSLDGGTPQLSNIFNGVSVGPHTITFTDGVGCPGSTTVTTTAGPALTATATATNTSCPAVSNAVITVTPTTGVAPYTYSLDGGTSQTPNTFANVAAGPHTIAFTDAIGCSGSTNVTVIAGAVISATATSTATSCPSVNNGTITVTPVTGTAPYSYSLDGGTSQASNIFNSVNAGPHVITFTDANTCASTVNITVAQGVAILATAATTATTCPGVNNGTFTVTPTTGTAPYLYAIDGGAQQASNVFGNLATGPHTATITDANGCTTTVTETIGQGTGLSSTSIPTSTSCPTVNNGSILVTPSTGTAPYLYSLNGGTPQSSNTFGNLAANTYTITLTDALGCQGTTTAIVTQGNFLESTVQITNPPCANINDGVITITPTRGSTPYLYSLNAVTPVPGNVFSNNAPGSYTISFTDAIGCTGTNTATLTTNSPITIGATVTEPLCNGNANGTITFSVNGGVPAYQYSKDAGVTYQTSATFNNLAANTYNFRIKDNVGCTKDTIIVLGEPTVLTVSATNSTSTCNGNDGTISVSASGGTTAYTYSIDGTSFQSSPDFTVSFGTYNNIQVKDANGCLATTSAVVTLVDNMFVDAGLDTLICAEVVRTFDIQTNPGTSIYVWTTLAGALVDSIKNPSVKPLDTTTYIVKATWGVCTKSDTVTIEVLRKPVANAGPNARICIGDSTIITGSATNVSGPVFYLWAPANLVRDTSAQSTWAIPDSSQVYTLTVKDDYSCNFAVTDQVTVFVQPPVPAFAGNDTIAVTGTPHTLKGSGGVQYLWSVTNGNATINNPNAAMPQAILNSNSLFALKVTDIAGCIGYDTVYVQIYDDARYYVPNSFTPNGDGLNDVFRAVPSGISRTEWFRVFNRYGEVVFETNQWLKGWDGTFKGKLQPTGTYIWAVKGYNSKGAPVEMKGTVNLIQ